MRGVKSSMTTSHLLGAYAHWLCDHSGMTPSPSNALPPTRDVLPGGVHYETLWKGVYKALEPN